jgi:hypothetical protein
MSLKEPLLRRIPKIYEKVRSWIIYGAMIFLIVILYFGDTLGSWREKLLATAALVILAILFEVVLDISKNLRIKPQREVFPSLNEALPRIREMVSHDRQTSVKIIAATGGTTVATILPAIMESSPARNINISMGILAPDTPYKKWIPRHWSREIETTIGRLKELEDDRTSVALLFFEMLPVPHGLLLNNEHLFLGFFDWATISGKSQLSGAQLPHHYYHRSNPEYEYCCNLFESWFTHSPRRELKGNVKDR